MMYRVTVTRETDIVPPKHPLAQKKSIDGFACLPEAGDPCIVYSKEEGRNGGLVTSIVHSILECTYKEGNRSFDTITFKTKNTKYVMKIHGEVN
jgi:hypothetical protein